jgi:hypothetical protein
MFGVPKVEKSGVINYLIYEINIFNFYKGDIFKKRTHINKNYY